jgi:hypothetical protein
VTDPHRPYPIGEPGKPWGAAERAQWLAAQVQQRRYADDVLPAIEALGPHWERVVYGELAYGDARFPLVALRSRGGQAAQPTALITGGVHGYETSGVHGALAFARAHAAQWLDHFNLMVVPCVSPWAYERVVRWNANAVDPNRSFKAAGEAEEARALMRFVAPWADHILLHIDLHETTDTDETEFRPALAARDGTATQSGAIPDGFYLVADAPRPELGFQQAIIDAVARVTHIAPPDESGQIIGCPVVSPGVIVYDCAPLGLCASLTRARYVTTTEVYPDSPRATPEQCVAAQVAAVEAGLAYAARHPN